MYNEPNSFLFGHFGFFSALVMAIAAIPIVLRAAKVIKTWSDNHDEPIATCRSRVIAKRETREVVHTQSHHTRTRTDYFVTFEAVDGGQRLELEVQPDQYGLLVEGDEGNLRHQGTWYKGFDRNATYTGRDEGH